ncbi:uncharacterized protein LOC102803101 [Saccoglossus kowalevskii]|uniref:Uncharacterized protein LOC102803101 n=1 Tax=Saccoglossus kowalevskii TaxID=10224 RepID=A0ABM0N050_SACKO|nr:PREDICTED: uncharacterized protein LOC102803101 [Saccoglossus kowalevskii]
MQFYDESQRILSTKKFNLRQWNTSDPLLKQIIETDGRANPKDDVSILGIKWNSADDVLQAKQLRAPSFGPLTSKRDIVAYCASLYDPLGYYSPIQVRAKLIIQQLWLTNHSWDKPIESELLPIWQNTAEDLRTITDYKMNRKYFADKPTNVETHTFTDASTKAYGAAVYLVSDKESALAIAKTRIAPISKQKLTLPRLELMGVLIGTRLAQFVEHRYVNTTENPADLVTRGVSPTELIISKYWWQGPKWLTNKDNWPICDLFEPAKQKSNRHVKHNTTSEITSSESNVLHAVTTSPNFDRDEITAHFESATISEHFKVNSAEPKVIPKVASFNADAVFHIDSYRNLSHLMRVTAYVLRFIKVLKTRLNLNAPIVSDTENSAQKSTPDANEMITAEQLWIKSIKRQYYGELIDCLVKNNSHLGALRKQLKLFVDDNQLIRAGGRIQNANLPINTIHPLLLPGKHQYTTLVIRDAHV